MYKERQRLSLEIDKEFKCLNTILNFVGNTFDNLGFQQLLPIPLVIKGTIMGFG
jgi:hypothetical protein